MKIHFTKKEYRLLLDIVHIAEWVMNSYTVGDNPRSQPYDDIEQKILSYAKDFGFENLVMYDQKSQKFFPTREHEESEDARQFIEEFEAEVFWEELCNRLAQRDLLKEKGLQKVKKMNAIERISAEDEIAEKYNKEFVENGIRNLIISNG
jgi:hypothetical protein